MNGKWKALDRRGSGGRGWASFSLMNLIITQELTLSLPFLSSAGLLSIPFPVTFSKASERKNRHAKNFATLSRPISFNWISFSLEIQMKNLFIFHRQKEKVLFGGFVLLPPFAYTVTTSSSTSHSLYHSNIINKVRRETKDGWKSTQTETEPGNSLESQRDEKWRWRHKVGGIMMNFQKVCRKRLSGYYLTFVSNNLWGDERWG